MTTIGLLGQRGDIPIVLVDSYAPNLPFDSIVIENIAGATTAINHLIAQGHTNIGIIGWTNNSPPSINERFIGYTRALEAHNIPIRHVQESGLNREESPCGIPHQRGAKFNRESRESSLIFKRFA